MKHQPSFDTAFLKRAGHRAKKGVRENWKMGVFAMIFSMMTGTLIPMLEQWHADRAIAAEISAVETRMQKQLDDSKREQADRDRAQWEALRRNGGR